MLFHTQSNCEMTLLLASFICFYFGYVFSIDTSACDTCDTSCAILPPPGEAFPCYQGTPSNTKECYNSDPLIKEGSTWYCSNCTALGYPYYLENDPVYVQMELWEKNNTATPTTSPITPPPTVATTSLSPTLQPPTIAPTRLTTSSMASPSASPTPQQSFPVVTFRSNLNRTGVVGTSLEAASQAAVVNVTASSMGILVEDVTYVSATVASALLRSAAMELSAAEIFTAVTEVRIPLASIPYTDATQLYNSLVSKLADSVASGAFTADLVSISALFGATQTLHANVTSVASSAMTVVDPAAGGGDDGDEGSLDPAVIVIIAFGGLMLLLTALCFYWRQAQQHKAQPSSSVTNSPAHSSL